MKPYSNITTQSRNYPSWMFIVLPGVAMMLGWGLRGHIGGGPFGAMIPGAMAALSICLLLELPAAVTSIIVVFGVVGIGLGGEMTYGQTLGFLRNPDTIWWGTAGTTLKGAVWGLLGGTVFSLGFIYHRVSKKKIIYGLLLMLLGFFLGFKLVNEPMLLYFSDPANPRSESWAALLFGAISLLLFLRYKLKSIEYRLVFRFALFGLVGGGLGFGLGGFWMVLGSYLPNVIFNNWWKAMEFTFGLILGSSLGLAAWKSRKKIKEVLHTEGLKISPPLPLSGELGLLLIVALFTFWLIPNTIESIFRTDSMNGGLFNEVINGVVRVLVNYGFFGFVFVWIIIKIPNMAWQLGITLTFCHAAIDFVRDIYPDANFWSPFTMHFLWVFLMTLVIAILVAYFRRRKNSVANIYLLLIWSCIAISLLRLTFLSGSLSVSGMSFCQIICHRFFVDLFFIVSAIVVSWIIIRVESESHTEDLRIYAD